MKNFGIPITFDESSLRSIRRFHQRSGSLVKWTFFVICMEYRDSVIQKCNSKEILSANEELVLIYIFPHQEENQQELRDYFDDELWQDMKFTLNIRSRTCLQFVRRRFEDRMPTTGLPTAKDNDYILSSFYQSLFSRNNNIEDTHSHNYVDPIIKSFFPKAKIQLQAASRTSGSSARTKKRFDPSLVGSNPVLTRIDVCRNKTTQSTCRPDKPGSGNFWKNNESIKRLIYWKMLCHGSGIYRMALIGEFTFPKAQQLGETHGCFSGDGHSAGSREQGGQSFTQGRATQKNSQKLKIKNMMISFSN
ncbi:unnamed protein product [Rhizophagus irregularis]|nr:unnamed protein product [Rhizophagus irregularis]